jgi:hypothetical protein
MRRLALVLLAAGAAAVAALAATRPDPNLQAQSDGCVRDLIAIFKQEAPNWTYVGDKDSPASATPPAPQLVTGIVDAAFQPYLAAHPSGGDDPLSHLSYDFNITLKVDPQDSALVGTGNDAGEGEETGRIHTERELLTFPTWAWPEKGDRVTETGSWVWDCGHFAGGGERTEIHPYRGIWVERNPGGPSATSPLGEAEGDLFFTTQATPAGRIAECAHTVKGNVPAFKACVKASPDWLSVNGDYELTLRLPPRPPGARQVRIRVVDRGSVAAPKVVVRRLGDTVEARLAIDAPKGRKVVVAKQVFAGWAPMPPAALPVHLRLRFDSLLVRRAMDPSCPPDRPTCPARDESLLLGQIGDPPGEYQLYWDVAGVWGRWSPGTLRVRDGQTVQGRQAVDVYVAAGRPWRLYIHSRECDFGVLGSFAGQNVPVWPCPRSKELGNSVGDDFPGALEQVWRSPAAALGRHSANAILAGSSCPPANANGCYAVTYTVTRVRDEARRAGGG